MAKPPSDLADKFMLRMPDGMRDRLKAAAKENGRSMNAEIIARLERSFFTPAEIKERLQTADEIISQAELNLANMQKRNRDNEALQLQLFDAVQELTRQQEEFIAEVAEFRKSQTSPSNQE